MNNRPSASAIEVFLPSEPGQTEFLPWLTTVSGLARTCRGLYGSCRGLYGFFQDVFLLERLAHYIIVEPNVVEVIKMVRAYPELLNTNISKVVNHKGQVIRNNKPFSLAFGAGDDELCAALKEEMICFYGSKEAAEAEIEKQLNEKIGEENKEQDDRIKNQLDALLQSVTQAMTIEQFNLGRDANNKLILSPATLAAITAFREGLAALQPKIIDKGMHFRLNTLQETYDTYVQVAAQWGDNYNRCALFEDGVISSVLFYVPENDAQKFSQGLNYLYYVAKPQREDFARRLTLRGTNHNFYDYLRSPSGDFSLSGSCIDIVVGRRRRGEDETRRHWAHQAMSVLYKKFVCLPKTSNLQSLCSRSDLRMHQPAV